MRKLVLFILSAATIAVTPSAQAGFSWWEAGGRHGEVREHLETRSGVSGGVIGKRQETTPRGIIRGEMGRRHDQTAHREGGVWWEIGTRHDGLSLVDGFLAILGF